LQSTGLQRRGDRCGGFGSEETLRRTFLCLPGTTPQAYHLQMADLTGADLMRASLRAADLRGTNLRGTGLNETDLTAAIYDEHTQFPPGLNPDKAGMKKAE